MIPDVLIPPYSLQKLQALTAMSIFAMNCSSIQLDQALIYEAARMAQNLRYHKSPNSQPVHLKVFWTIYHLEKIASFTDNNSSVFADEDIGCDIPSVPSAIFIDYDWFLSAVNISRLTSFVYSTLFSTKSSSKSVEACLSSINNVRRSIEEWRLSVPVAFRPKEPLQMHAMTTPAMQMASIQTHYLYYNIIFAIERLFLHVEQNEKPTREESKWQLMDAARNVIELTQSIKIEPQMPIFFACIMPILALFILFDFIIHNPTHKETARNLTLLDKAAMYLRQIDVVSGGALPGTIFTTFSSIASQYILKVQGGGTSPSITNSEVPDGIPPTFNHLPSFDFTNIDFSPINPHLGSADQIPNFDLPTPSEPDTLNYPPKETQQSGNQIQDLRTVFGFVFPEWGDQQF